MHHHIGMRIKSLGDIVGRVLAASAIVLTLCVGGLWGRDFSYQWEPGLLLEYRLFLETRVHFDLDHRDEHLKTESRYSLKFYVVESTPRGEALVASICRLEEAGVDAVSRDAHPQPARELQARIHSFSRKEDFSFLVLDERGHILRGRMPWPEAVNYHVAKILEGIGIGEPGPVRGSCFLPGSSFAGMEELSGRSCRVYSAKGEALDLRLYVDAAERIPCSLKLHFAGMSHFTIFDEYAALELLDVQRSVGVEDLSADPLMTGALIRCAVVHGGWKPDPEMIRRALADENPRVRKTAAGYFASTGEPADLNGDEYRKHTDEIVRFNIAKGIYRFRGDSSLMNSFLKAGDPELQIRARNLLEPRPRSGEEADDELVRLLEKYRDPQADVRQGEIYRAAAVRISQPPPVRHFGMKSRTLHTKEPGNKCFRYNVRIPEDYDPGERYPVVIGLSGGNGFSEWYFLETAKMLPDNFILVHPDAENAYWWEPEGCRMIGTLLQSLGRDFSVDWDRIYLQGFSNGGIAAYLFTRLYPDRFAAAASMMGFAPQAGDPERVETEMFRNLRNMPLLIIHGALDRTISVTLDRILVSYLKKNGLPHRYIELENKGHEITMLTNFRDVMRFFRKARRDAAPRRVELIVDDPEYNRSGWIRLDEKSDQTQRARIDARINGNRFIIHTRNVKTLSLLLNDRHYDEGTETEVVINGKRRCRGDLRLDPRTLRESMIDERDPARIYGVCLTFELDE